MEVSGAPSQQTNALNDVVESPSPPILPKIGIQIIFLDFFRVLEDLGIFMMNDVNRIDGCLQDERRI